MTKIFFSSVILFMNITYQRLLGHGVLLLTGSLEKNHNLKQTKPQIHSALPPTHM